MDSHGVARHLADRPSALLLMGETPPVGAYRAFRELGLEPGRDVAVIGLRDHAACPALLPDLTCFTLALDDPAKGSTRMGVKAPHWPLDSSRRLSDASRRKQYVSRPRGGGVICP